ncbi:50S ribosomal protein L11 methyltransferase [Deinococcus budaensis]|uniref:Ribosomal protein L11 methyltransferase n=1 Tax=Deinococcus budaensis TaxID=1665626 RepID=A0A7W8LP04_9DEIO|nr:50S ribosomal protein L11 methyltransferase [Deinococcus budaensis]MBB5233122.1 ribosomal protein L11 methyltransferase [Deinococcus budaensis]
MLVYHLPGTLETREHDLDLLWEAGATGLEERAGVIRAYFEARTELPAALADGEWREEADQDWQAEFRRTLRPVVAGRITIVAPWQREEVTAGQTPLVIEPGMAFGTGHHATTRLAVEALSELGLEALGPGGQGARVLDVGTGSGVLAIAAALLGARFAFGVDIDPITIPIARENAEINGVPAGRVRFEEGTLGLGQVGEGQDALTFPEEGVDAYDVLVANLYAELHDLLAGDYAEHLVPGGVLVLTGILTVKLPLVRAALAREGFGDVQETVDGEWARVTARAPR